MSKPIDNESPTRVVLYIPDGVQQSDAQDVKPANPLPVVKKAGWVMDSGGVLRPVQRTTVTGSTLLGANLVIPAQGPGIRIRVLQVHSWVNSFLFWTYYFASAATAITGVYGGVAGVYNDWRMNEHGHFQTLANEALNLVFNVAGNYMTFDVLWIQDIP